MTRGATSCCRMSTRNAEQRWPALLNPEATASSTTCSGSAELSTSIALMPPVSAMKVAIAPRTGGEAAFDEARRLGRSGKDDACNARVARQCGAHRGALARQELQHLNRHAGLMQDCTASAAVSGVCSAGLASHRIARRECRAHLSGEDCEREIPRD